MIRKVLPLLTAAALVAGHSADASDCPSLDSGQATCQVAIAAAGASYASARLKAIQKCLRSIQTGKLTGDPATICRGSTPTDPKTVKALTKAATKAHDAMTADCTDAQVASLQLCASTVAGLDCVLADHVQRTEAMLEAEYGAVAQSSDKSVQKCQGTIGKEAAKLAQTRLKLVQGCLNARNAACGTPGTVTRCLAPASDGAPAEQDLLAKLAKAETKFRAKLQKKCPDSAVGALDACGNTATTVADCLVCSHANAADLLLGAEYRAVRVVNATTSLQSAADAAETEDTILVEPGTYTEEVTLKDSGLTVRGLRSCDTGDRPLVLPPSPSSADGIYFCGSRLPGCPYVADNVLLQSLEVNNFNDNDVYTVGVEGVSYRDTVTRGPSTTNVTRYGLYPVQSNNVLLDGCLATGISDAGLYVGQSTNIIVRNCEVHDSVAGIEIENSGNAQVYDNYAHDNAGGILVFKLPGLPVQLSDCHVVRNNRTLNNNGVNYGVGTVGLVPSGTGIIMLSTDSTVVRDNVSTGNKSFGITIVDQRALNAAFSPPPFPTVSPDQNVNDNSIIGNTLTGNAFDPDPDTSSFSADVTFFAISNSNNCQNGNAFDTDFGDGFAALPACPSVPVQPGCPVPPPTISTSTTTTSTTMPSGSTTTTLPWTFAAQVQPLLGSRCGACHGGSGTPQYAGLMNLDDPSQAYGEIVNVPSMELPTMDRVEPSDPDNSYLLHKVEGTQGTVGGSGSRMPLGGPYLSTDELDGIRGWIEDGALDN